MNDEPSINPAMKRPPESNSAFAGVIQDDDPAILDQNGEQQASERARTNLSAYIANVFDANKMLRETNGVDEDLSKRLRQMNGEYDPQDKAELLAKGHPLCYINISAHKQRTLVAWLTEFFSDSERSFYIRPTPIPEMSNEIVQKAVRKTMEDWAAIVSQTGQMPNDEEVAEYASKTREEIYRESIEESKECAVRMERRLKDDMVEGKWAEPVDDFINLLATYGTAGMRSPVIRLKKAPTWDNSDSVKRVIDKMKLVREAEAISPWDMFPSNGATSAQDGDFCIRVRYSAKDLRAMGRLNCYFEDNISRVLYMYGETGVKVRVTSDSERERLEKKDDSSIRATKIIEGVEFWGQASGKMLIGMGITRTPDKSPVKDDEWYEVNAIVIENMVIYCRIIDSSEERPIDVAGVFRVTGSFWHQGPLQVADHIQRLCNATSRNLLVNMGFAAGPQSYIDDMARLHPMDDGKARPNKTWAFYNNGQSAARPINFFSIPSVATELINIFQFYMRLADEITGIPAFANGTDAAVGAARALADYEKVLTPDGSVEISKLKVGDKVFNTYSGVSSVTGVYPQGERDILRMHFSNGEKIDCDADHRWTVSDHPERKSSWKTMTTRQIIDAGIFRKTITGKKNPKGMRPKFCLPYVESLGYEHKDVTIDPYTLGALIGNGDKRCRLCTMDQEVFDRVPYELGMPDSTSTGKATTRTVVGIKKQYHDLGLGVHGLEKFVPESYLFNSKEIRLELLRGLMDTDGCASANGDHVFFSTSSKKLADDFVKLVKSLGASSVSLRSEAASNGVIKGSNIKRQENYRICFNLDSERVFWLDRKQSRVHKRPRVRVYITGIELAGKHSATCITVDAKDSLFICDNFIPTHNTATGLNMLFGAANRGVKKIVANMDAVLKSCIGRLYWWHMRYSQDESIKGDVTIEVCGVKQFTAREQLAQKHIELLRVIGQDQRMMQLQSPEELAKMLREIATGFELSPDSLAPSDDEMKRRIEDAKEKAEAEMAMNQELMMQQAQAQAQQGVPQEEGQGMPQPQQASQRPPMPPRGGMQQ